MRNEKPESSEQGPEPAAAVRAEPSSDDPLTASLRGFGPLGILAVLAVLAGNLIVVPLSAVLALVWVHLSRTPWYEIGYVRPKNWAASLAVGLIFGSTFKLLMKAVVMPLLGADPINQAYHYLAGNSAALPGMVLTIVV